MGRTALYHDPIPFRPARAELQLEADVLVLRMPDGRQCRYALDGCTPTIADGFVAARRDGTSFERPAIERSATSRLGDPRRGGAPPLDRSAPSLFRDMARPSAFDRDATVHVERRFVRMLILEREYERNVVITPPDCGAVAPNVVPVPEAPLDAAIVDLHVWEALGDYVMNGGRLAACAISDLARLAAIASSAFAAVIGEVAAQRALELAWMTRGPLRGGSDIDTALQPLVDLARTEPRAAEALVSALAHAAGASRSRRKTS